MGHLCWESPIALLSFASSMVFRIGCSKEIILGGFSKKTDIIAIWQDYMCSVVRKGRTSTLLMPQAFWQLIWGCIYVQDLFDFWGALFYLAWRCVYQKVSRLAGTSFLLQRDMPKSTELSIFTTLPYFSLKVTASTNLCLDYRTFYATHNIWFASICLMELLPCHRPHLAMRSVSICPLKQDMMGVHVTAWQR